MLLVVEKLAVGNHLIEVCHEIPYVSVLLVLQLVFHSSQVHGVLDNVRVSRNVEGYGVNRILERYRNLDLLRVPYTLEQELVLRLGHGCGGPRLVVCSAMDT